MALGINYPYTYNVGFGGRRGYTGPSIGFTAPGANPSRINVNAGARPRRGGAQADMGVNPYQQQDQALAALSSMGTAGQSQQQQLSMDEYLDMVAQGQVPPPPGGVHVGNLIHPKRSLLPQTGGRRWAARRGYRGPILPGDEIQVHDGETVRVAEPTNIEVVPKRRGVGYRGGIPPQQPNPQQTEYRPLSVDDRIKITEQNKQFVERGNQQRSRVRQRLDDQAMIQDTQLSGAPLIDDATVAQYQAAQRGEIRPDQIASPAGQRAARALYENGASPIRDARRAQYRAEYEARLPAAMEQLNANDGMGQKPDAEQMSRREAARQRRMDREAVASSRRANMGYADLDENGRVDINDVLTTRSANRRRAVEEFGTDRPMAVGALPELDRRRRNEDILIAGQAAGLAQGRGTRSSGTDPYTKGRIDLINKAVEAGTMTPQDAAAAIDAMEYGGPQSGGQPVNEQLAQYAIDFDPLIQQLEDVPTLEDPLLGIGRTQETLDSYGVQLDQFSSRLDDLEKMPDDQKKIVANAILDRAMQLWTKEYFGDSDLKRQRDQQLERLKKMAGVRGRGRGLDVSRARGAWSSLSSN